MKRDFKLISDQWAIKNIYTCVRQNIIQIKTLYLVSN